MSEHQSEGERKNGNKDVWRWIAGLLLGALVGTWTGEFAPNRNIATTDQVAKVEVSVTTLTDQVSTLREEVSELKGELNGRNMLKQAPE